MQKKNPEQNKTKQTKTKHLQYMWQAQSILFNFSNIPNNATNVYSRNRMNSLNSVFAMWHGIRI